MKLFRIKNRGHKRSLSRNEESKDINSQYFESNGSSKATQILTKRGDVLPPVKSKIIVLDNQ